VQFENFTVKGVLYQPDSGAPQGREALQFNRGLTNAKNVRLELDVQERIYRRRA